MKITVDVQPRGRGVGESAIVSLAYAGLEKPFALDLDLSPLFDRSTSAPSLATDFLFIASVVYAIDKIVSRTGHAEDCWTRDLVVTIPVRRLDAWRPLAGRWSECVSFLTGDRWHISFCRGSRRIAQRDTHKRRRLSQFRGDAVGLFSGGLDSYIGAIDWLSSNPRGKLILVGHHDRHVKGPMIDQTRLSDSLKQEFPGRVEIIQTRAGVVEAAPESSFRSRSLVFLGFGVYVAELLGQGVPVIIPENGPIALNVPLSPSRRGSCSTRTVHPRFINGVEAIIRAAGLNHAVSNPYAFKTKGEMVKECGRPELLARTCSQSVSCAKSGHTVHWNDRRAGACGRCVPCLFRRAALSAKGLDVQPYGFDVLSPAFPRRMYGEDFSALLAFLKRNPSEAEIAQALFCNGPVMRGELTAAVSVVTRMMSEVRAWIAAKGSPTTKRLAGISRD